MLEIDDDWEPFIRISIFNQDFLAYCDIGSMVSTMPKTAYNSLKLLSMVDLPCYLEYSNGDISEIQGKVNNIQVRFAKRDAAVDFIILKSTNQGNIVLGRDFLRAMKGFIDIGKGQIRLRGKAKGTYIFPRKRKRNSLKSKLQILMTILMMPSLNLDLVASCLAQRHKRKRLLGGNPKCFYFQF